MPCCANVSTDILDLILPSYLVRVLQLTLLAPDLVEAILVGRHGAELTFVGLLEGVSAEWERQISNCG